MIHIKRYDALTKKCVARRMMGMLRGHSESQDSVVDEDVLDELEEWD
jgi:hypothetical protein